MARAEVAGRQPGGRSLGSLLATGGQPNRVIYDQQHQTNGVGPAVRAERQEPVPDASVNQAYDGLGATYTFYLGHVPPRLDRRRRDADARPRPLRHPLQQRVLGRLADDVRGR